MRRVITVAQQLAERRMLVVLTAAGLAVQVVDWLQTYAVLGMGGREYNPAILVLASRVGLFLAVGAAKAVGVAVVLAFAAIMRGLRLAPRVYRMCGFMGMAGFVGGNTAVVLLGAASIAVHEAGF